jgi:hypothetical protein
MNSYPGLEVQIRVFLSPILDGVRCQNHTPAALTRGETSECQGDGKCERHSVLHGGTRPHTRTAEVEVFLQVNTN